MKSKFTIQKNTALSFNNLRGKFYHPIHQLPKKNHTRPPYLLWAWIVLLVLWLAAARSDASILFP